MDNNELRDLLKESLDVQVAVIATKVCYMEDKLDCIDRKVGNLVAWKIKVGAVSAAIGSVVSFILLNINHILRFIDKI